MKTSERMKIEDLVSIETFCFCFDLRYGGLIFGYFDLILSAIWFAFNIDNILSLHFIVELIMLVQDIMFVWGIHSVSVPFKIKNKQTENLTHNSIFVKNRAKFMVGAVYLSLERAFFFIGLWAYLSMYGNELIDGISKFKTSIERINQIERSEEGSSTAVVGVFVMAWLIFTLIACK